MSEPRRGPYADDIERCWANGKPPYDVGQIEAAMRLETRGGCLDALSDKQFVRAAFNACQLLGNLKEHERQELAWSYGLD